MFLYQQLQLTYRPDEVLAIEYTKESEEQMPSEPEPIDNNVVVPNSEAAPPPPPPSHNNFDTGDLLVNYLIHTYPQLIFFLGLF